MTQCLYCYSRWVVLLLVSILIGTGCNGSGGGTTPTPTPPLQVNLTAAAIIVERLREGTNPYELQKDEVVSDLQMNDRISVKEHGRGLLRFSDSLLIELFRNTDALVPQVRLDQGGFIFVRLKQVFGHSRTRLESIAKGRVTIETDYATITALVNNTEVAVCHAPELTCMVALSGEVEVEAQGQAVLVKAGESTYIFPGKPPQAPICANLEEVRAWLDKKRGPEEIDPLGALVVGWPQEPCHEAISQPPPLPEPAASPISAPAPTLEPVAPPTAPPTVEPEPILPPTEPPTSEPEPIAPTPLPIPPQALCTVLIHTLNLRYGPSFGYWPPIATLFTGTLLEPLARNPDGRWIQVKVRESGQTGWVSTKPAYISCNILVADLPVSE